MDDYVPSEFFLSQNYPNPFCDKTKIKFCIPFKMNVKLSVYNSDRELMIMLVNEEKEAGTYEAEFSLLDRQASAKGESASGGDTTLCHSREGGNLSENIYYYQLKTGNYNSEKKMLFLK
jgi:hypothetical protein